jgi:hypothetical protein
MRFWHSLFIRVIFRDEVPTVVIDGSNSFVPVSGTHCSDPVPSFLSIAEFIALEPII